MNAQNRHGHGHDSITQVQSIEIEYWRRCLIQHTLRQPVRPLILLAWYLLEADLNPKNVQELEDQAVDSLEEVFVDDVTARRHKIAAASLVDPDGHAVDQVG